MAKQDTSKSVELVYPLYLDVSMMTSFLAALEDGVAYGSDVTQMVQEQKDRGTEGGGRVGVSPGILSSLFGFDIRGKITNNSSAGSNEEVKVIRKHTESSLFMGLRHRLKQQNLIENLDQLQDTRKLHKLDRSSLVEISGDISRSPLSEMLELFSRFVNIAGTEALDEEAQAAQNAESQRSSEDPGETAFASGGTGNSGESVVPEEITVPELFNRIREDLNKSRVIDVVMHPSSGTNLTVVIALVLHSSKAV